MKTRKLDSVLVKKETKSGSGAELSLPGRGNGAGSRVSLEILRPGARQVYVAGSFNGWKPDTTPLRSVGNGRWKGDLALNPGRYEYLFVVDGQWLPDPNAKESVGNPYGGRNSVVTVAA